MRSIHRQLLLILTLLVGVIFPASALAAPEAGLNVFGIDNGGNDEMMQVLADTGSKWSRHFLEWDRFEPTKGQYDQALIESYKKTMDREQAIGVKTMITVVRSPSWASGSADPYMPPTDPQDFGNFMGHIAREFAGRVEALEVWNEADEDIFWKGTVDAAQYANLVKSAYPAVKASDPNIKVIFGPTTGNNYGFLQQAYTAGVKDHFDAVSVHTDTACSIAAPSEYYRDDATGRIGQFTFLGYREVRDVMLSHGDDKPIYMSELGWSTTQTRCARGAFAGKKDAGVSEAKQAAFLSQAYHCLAADPYVQVALWFNAKDPSAEDTELGRYGLMRHNSTHKPAYAAFKDYAQHGDKLHGPCGDFTAPRIRVQSPGANAKVFDKMVLKADTPDKDVVRMTFMVDGKLVENYTAPKNSPVNTVRDFIKHPAYRNWQGVRKLSFGPHTLTVVAKDVSGNQSKVEIPFQRVDPNTLSPQKTVIKDLKLSGKGKKRTFQGKLASPGLDFGIQGKVEVIWQAKRKAGWKKIHGGMANSNKPFTFNQKLKYSGKWRVRVRYLAVKPYKSSVSPWKQFTVR